MLERMGHQLHGWVGRGRGRGEGFGWWSWALGARCWGPRDSGRGRFGGLGELETLQIRIKMRLGQSPGCMLVLGFRLVAVYQPKREPPSFGSTHLGLLPRSFVGLSQLSPMDTCNQS